MARGNPEPGDAAVFRSSLLVNVKYLGAWFLLMYPMGENHLH
jgi:hypothetical protein